MGTFFSEAKVVYKFYYICLKGILPAYSVDTLPYKTPIS